jgi:hypothetical protein
MDPFDLWAQWLLHLGLAYLVETGRGDVIVVLE